MTGDQKRGDAVADKWRDTFDKNRRETDLELMKLQIRADMRSNPDEEEDSAVIDQRALEAQRKKESEPPGSPGVLHIVFTGVRKLPPWGAVLVAVVAIAAYTVLALRGVLPVP